MSEDLPGHLLQALVQTGNMHGKRKGDEQYDQKDWS
jgi:hypothetical protein